LELLLAEGVESIASRVMVLKAFLYARRLPLGFTAVGPVEGPSASGILTVWHPGVAASKLFARLESEGIVASLRFDRTGKEFIRFSPHFYNTTAELERVGEVLADAVSSR